MTIKEAMKSYFSKLELLYRNTFGSYPTVSWDSELEQDLFIGEPDEDGEIQWVPKEAAPEYSSELNSELQEFYSSYYYWELRGEYDGVLFDFPALPSGKVATIVISASLADGEYYFPKQQTVLIASCLAHGNDDLLLFYRQNSKELFIYDIDKRFVYPLDCSLTDLISKMKAVI